MNNITQFQFLRGTTAQNNSYTGRPGEITVDTQLKQLRIHDGVTPGGFIVSGGGASFPFTGSLLASGSNINISGSLTASFGFFGTASQAVTASYALSANSQTIDVLSGGSTTGLGIYSGSFFGTASQAVTASYALNAGTGTAVSASRSISTEKIDVLSGGSTTGLGIYSGSFFGTTSYASQALTSSYAINAGSGAGFPFTGSAIITGSLLVSGSGIRITGSLNITQGITGSLLGTASNAVTSSYSIFAVSSSRSISTEKIDVLSGGSTTGFGIYSGSFFGTASHAVTSSYAINATPGFPFSGSAVITGSLLVSSSGIRVTGSLNVTQGITGSLLGTASTAGSSSYSLTASYSISSSNSLFAVSASRSVSTERIDVLTGGSTTGLGIYSGSFFGTSSWANTSSFALNAVGTGFPFSGSAIITGSLLISGSGINLIGGGLTGSVSGSITGTASTASLALSVSGSANRILYNNANNVTTTTSSLYFDGSRMGIGTTTPSASLTVFGNSIQPSSGIVLFNSLSTLTGSYIWNGTPGNYDSYLKFGLNPTDQNDFTFAINRSSLVVRTGKTIQMEGTAYLTHASTGNYQLSFENGTSTKLGSATFISLVTNGSNESIRILANGRVGIGTTVPSASLQIQGDVSASSYTSSINNAVGFLGTSSWAVSASRTVSASRADSSALVDVLSGGSTAGLGIYSGSFFGTSSWAVSASQALTASFALNAASGAGFPFSGSAVITGSLLISGSGINLIGGGLTGSISGSLSGTASFATTASFAPVGPGTINSIALFNSSNTISSSVIFQSGSNIGIGLQNPGFALHVVTSESLGAAVTPTLGLSANSTRVGIRFISSSITAGRTHDLYHHTGTSLAEWILGTPVGSTSFWRFMPEDNSSFGIVITTPRTGTTARIRSALTSSLGIGANGVDDIIWLTGSRQVGIGTTSPDANLTVFGQASFNSGSLANPGIARRGDLNTGIYFPADDTIGFVEGGSEAMRIDSSGRVIVGTTAAQTNGTLQVSGSIGMIGNTQIRQATNSDGNSLQIFPTQLVASSNNSTGIAYADGALLAGVSNADGIRILDVGRIANTAGRLVVNNQSTSNISLSITKDSITHFYADTTGNVGINTSSPNARLQISGSSSQTLLRIGSPTATSILFVSGSGNIGIGTTNPANTLQIEGNVSASSYTSSVSNGVGYFGTASRAISASRADSSALVDVLSGGSTTGLGIYSGSFFGTSSWANTASFALNAVGTGFPYTGNAVITGSLLITGSGLTVIGTQSITSTTNSTFWNNGALTVAGGVGIGKDVNISGSLTVLGLLTAVTLSTQYVTSSQVIIGDNKIILNDDDLVRFAGISIVDSGSTVATASIYWDSLNHKFIYENISGEPYNSAMFIAGPKNTGTLGNEVGLTVGRVPVASGDDHIDSRIQSSSIRVDFPSRLTHVEAGLTVTGSVSASSFTGSLLGTASWAQSSSVAISSSFATTASGASTFLGGTANRILYNNASNVTTTSANLTFDNNILTVNTNNLYVSGGRIGIRTTNPTNTLTVVGDIIKSSGSSYEVERHGAFTLADTRGAFTNFMQIGTWTNLAGFIELTLLENDVGHASLKYFIPLNYDDVNGGIATPRTVLPLYSNDPRNENSQGLYGGNIRQLQISTSASIVTFRLNSVVTGSGVNTNWTWTAKTKNCEITATPNTTGVDSASYSIFTDTQITQRNGNVGIGTLTPGTKLHIQGNVSASSYTTSVSNAVGFVGTSSWAQSSSVATVSTGLSGGTTNYIPLWTSATAQSSSAIYQNGSNIGVGTILPDANLTVQGQASFNSGSVSVPGIAARGDLNTGIYFPNADEIALVEGGNEVMRINSASNVGINTGQPQKKLDVVGTDGDAIQFRTSTRNIGIGQVSSEPTLYWGSTTPLTFFSGVERMRIDANGNVGIGTTSVGTGIKVDINTVSDANTAPIRGRNTAVANSGVVTINIPSSSGAYATAARLGDIVIRSETTGGDLILGGKDSLHLGAGGTDYDTRLFITGSNGNVGIGTTNPTNTLQIQGNVSASSYTSSISNAVGFLGTSSWAVSSSRTISASRADSSAQVDVLSGGSTTGLGIYSGSFFGTSSWAVSASQAFTASYALNAGGATAGFPYTGNAIITGSLVVSSSGITLIGSGLTGSVFGTSSWAQSSSVAISSSFATTANTVLTNTVSYTAGAGLTGGGSATLGGSSVTINVGAGNGITVNADDVALNTSSAHFVTGARATISSADTTGASGINLRYNNLTGVISGSLVNSSVTVNGQTVSLGGSTTITANTTNALTLGNGLTGTSFNGSTAVTTTVDTSSAHFTNGVKAKLNTDGVISSSTQFTSLTAPFTGSFTGSFTGALIGTSSWATTAVGLRGGTANYIPLWTSTTAQSSSVIFQSGSNIGINLTNPTQKLTVDGAVYATGTGGISYYMDNNRAIRTGTAGSTVYFDLGTVIFRDGNAVSANAAIDVYGTITSRGNLTVVAGGNTQVSIGGTSTNSYTQLYFSGSGRQYGIGVGNASETTYGVANEFFLFDHNAGTMRMVVDTSGNVGIGTTNPVNTLQIQGNVSASSYTSSISNAVGYFGTASRAVSASRADSSALVDVLSGGSTTGLGIYSGSFSGSFFGNSSTGNVGPGTVNSIALFNATTTVSSSIIFQNNNNIGVGTTSAPNFKIEVSGSVGPSADNQFDLGSSTRRWANLYTGDLNLSNEGSMGNIIDGTTGNWTIQEGEEYLYIINKKSGKRYRFMLEEVE